jgi:hypothetical protein
MTGRLKSTANLLAALALIGSGAAAVADTASQAAITTFNAWCFKAGQTEAQARRNMQADTANFTLTFWDDSLEPRPADAPGAVERRCEVAFAGDHRAAAITALQIQMATAPVFGTAIALPDSHHASQGSALIQARELLRGRVAVVQVGTRELDGALHTFMAVDRLYAGLGLPEGRS